MRLVLIVLLLLPFLLPGQVQACESYTPNPPHEPSGVKGCVHYGEGIASRYPGPGVARNDCVWPWDDCTPIQITSHQTGRSIIVTPTMYCDCYQRPGPNGETTRIVDLDPAAVAALGLDWDRGMYAVTVEPASIAPMLPDTAMTELREDLCSDTQPAGEP